MLRLRTFGGLSVENATFVGGAAARRRPLAVLALLAASDGRGLSREKIAALLWPESDEERARASLRQALTVLRSELSVSDLVLGTTELRLNPDVITSDVAEFDAYLVSGDDLLAVECYAGAFLDGVFLRNAPEFERWADRERVRLQGRQADALHRLAAEASSRGDPQEAVRWWRRAVALEPTSTRAATSLVEALLAAGDREEAIVQARAYATRVRDELEVEPDPALMRRLADLLAPAEIVAHTPRRHGGDGAEEPAPPPPSEDPPPPGVIAGRPEALQAGRRPAVRRRSLVATASAIGAIALLGAFGYVVGSRSSADRELVLVLPFENRTGDSAYDVVASMASDWVRQGLVHTELVSVVEAPMAAHDSSANAGGGAEAGWSAARRAGANLLVRGSIYGGRDSLVARAQIIRLADGTVVYDGDPIAAAGADPRAAIELTRERLMGAFAALSDSRFRRWEATVIQPPRFDAYQEFVAGLEAQRHRRNDAFDHFVAAARLDTSFARAKVWAQETSSDETRALGDSLLDAAWSQRTRLSPYDRALVDYAVAARSFDRPAALLAARRLTAMAPYSPDPVGRHATAAVLTNRLDEALRVVHRAEPHLLGRPDDPVYTGWHFNAHHLAGDFDGELAEMRRAAARGLVLEDPLCVPDWIPLAALGREAAVDSIQATCAARPHSFGPGAFYLNVGQEYRAHGHHEAAARAFARARAWYESQRPPWHSGLTMVDWLEGNWQAVFDYWRAEMKEKSLPVVGYGRLGAAAAHLGDTATAREMLRRIGEAPEAPRPHARLVWQAIVTAALGDEAGAVQLLERAIELGYSPLAHGHLQPGFDPLRGYPEFEAMLRPRK